jgi:hypothetical protein
MNLENMQSQHETYSFTNIIKYIKENYGKILLLILVFVVILVVEYITILNASLYPMPSIIPGVTSSSNNINLKKSKKNK